MTLSVYLINHFGRVGRDSARSIAARHALESDPPEVRDLLPTTSSVNRRSHPRPRPVNRSRPLSTRIALRERPQGSGAAPPEESSVLSSPRRGIDNKSLLSFFGRPKRKTPRVVAGSGVNRARLVFAGKKSGSAVGRLCEPCSLVRDPRFNPFSARRSFLFSRMRGCPRSGAESATKQPIDVKLEAGKTSAWCRCGLSKGQPFCDGSHKAL